MSERDLEQDPEYGVKRGLKTRHISMMALAGIIGPGLLVGAGGALASGGPAALLIGFGAIGIIALPVMNSVGEMSTLYPAGGGFVNMADRFVDKAFAAAVGWNYFIIWVTVLSNEYNTVSSIMSFWSDKVPIYGYFLLFWVAFLAFQLLGVKTFGEAEFWLALFKIVGLAAFFIFSIVYASGGVIGQTGGAVGFRYWHNPGPFAQGFRGVATVFVFCSTFYAGIESVAVASSETRNPQIAIPRAIKQVFVRIIFVYMGSAFFFGLTVPYNAQGLVGSEGAKALQSPMTIAIQNAGFEGGVHLVNAFILITCISAINSSIYVGSRTVFFMAKSGMAPRFFARSNKRGVMVPAIVLTNLFGALSLMNVSTGASEAYQYIVNLSGVSTFLVWASICFTHLRFRASWAAQGHVADELPFRALWYPYTSYFGMLASIFLALVQGWSTLVPFNAGNFVDSYILLPVFAIIYVLYKVILKTKIRDIKEINLEEGQRLDIDKEVVKTGRFQFVRKL